MALGTYLCFIATTKMITGVESSMGRACTLALAGTCFVACPELGVASPLPLGQAVASLLACAYRIHVRRSALSSRVSCDMEARPRLICTFTWQALLSSFRWAIRVLTKTCPCYIHCSTYMAHVVLSGRDMVRLSPSNPPTHTFTSILFMGCLKLHTFLCKW